MGSEKALVKYAGEVQYRRAAALLLPWVRGVYISCREEQSELFPDLEQIHDCVPWAGRGPVGGVRSAFAAYPGCAWLVLAVDYPYLAAADVEKLVRQRNAASVATVYRREDTGFIEPLIGIYEPAIVPIIDEALSEGRESLRFLLTRANIITPEADRRLENVNFLK